MKLHIGCGKKFIPGFVHVDALPYDHVDHVCAADDLSFLEDGSVSLIYACHILEHFGREAFKEPLREWFRVLEPGGVLRLAVPDFAACARLYVEGQLDNGILDIMGLVVGGQRDQYDYHYVIFDETMLSAALRDIGFDAVRRWDWRRTEHSDLDDYSQAYLPHMDKDNGTLVSLNLEAEKP